MSGDFGLAEADDKKVPREDYLAFLKKRLTTLPQNLFIVHRNQK